MVWYIVKRRIRMDKVKVLWHVWVTVVCSPGLSCQVAFGFSDGVRYG